MRRTTDSSFERLTAAARLAATDGNERGEGALPKGKFVHRGASHRGNSRPVADARTDTKDWRHARCGNLAYQEPQALRPR